MAEIAKEVNGSGNARDLHSLLSSARDSSFVTTANRGDSCLRSKEQHQKVERVRVKDNAFVGRSVKIDVVDDTALLNVVPFCKKGKDHHPKRSGAAHSDDKEALNKPEGGIKVEWHRYSR
ncbi:Uncharacterized protein Rs2_38552 [Raphanus sativus]|nr:Uncharacterized protein Rs2_38552 [Raphanus sativus]